MALLDRFLVNLMPPLDGADVERFRKSVRSAAEDIEAFEKLQAALERVVITPTV